MEVKKGASILFDFRASHSGAVGFVFKYLDQNNFYIFEIGGSSLVTARYFQVRRILDGVWTTLRRINTNAEIPFLPFFGYEVKAWYSVQAIIEEDEFKFSIALLGISQRIQILHINDDKIKRGKVGFSTSGTEAVFAEISIRPPAIPFCNIIILQSPF